MPPPMRTASRASGHDGDLRTLRLMVQIQVELSNGPTVVSGGWTPGDNGATVIVAHGAGTGKDHPFLTGYVNAPRCERLLDPAFQLPVRGAGTTDAGTCRARDRHLERRRSLRTRVRPLSEPLWATGKSYGGRMASMAVAEGMLVDGLAYLGYPLHPPGRPEKPRIEHLPGITVPQLFVEGTNDPFIQPMAQFEEAVASCQDARVVWVEGAGHAFEVKGHKCPAAEMGVRASRRSSPSSSIAEHVTAPTSPRRRHRSSVASSWSSSRRRSVVSPSVLIGELDLLVVPA